MVKGVQHRVCTTPDECMRHMEEGERNRHIGKTNMNLHSSRSHAVFMMVFESRVIQHEADTSGQHPIKHLMSQWTAGKKPVNVSHCNLVDLAGSERFSKTHAQGARLKEGEHINKSLMTLGIVIHKLSENGKLGHVPYRDSKLTRMLAASLSGNSRTAVVCNVSPAWSNFDETRSTLTFATRAAKITTRARRNEVYGQDAMLNQYRNEIEQLKRQLAAAGHMSEKHATDAHATERQSADLFKRVKGLEYQLAGERERSADLAREVGALQAKLVDAGRRVREADARGAQEDQDLKRRLHVAEERVQELEDCAHMLREAENGDDLHVLQRAASTVLRSVPDIEGDLIVDVGELKQKVLEQTGLIAQYRATLVELDEDVGALRIQLREAKAHAAASAARLDHPMVDSVLAAAPAANGAGAGDGDGDGDGGDGEPRYLAGLRYKLMEIFAQKKISQAEYDAAAAALDAASVEIERIGYKEAHYERDVDGVIHRS